MILKNKKLIFIFCLTVVLYLFSFWATKNIPPSSPNISPTKHPFYSHFGKDYWPIYLELLEETKLEGASDPKKIKEKNLQIIKKIEQILEKNPDPHPAFYNSLAYSYLKLKDYPSANKYADLAMEKLNKKSYDEFTLRYIFFSLCLKYMDLSKKVPLKKSDYFLKMEQCLNKINNLINNKKDGKFDSYRLILSESYFYLGNYKMSQKYADLIYEDLNSREKKTLPSPRNLKKLAEIYLKLASLNQKNKTDNLKKAEQILTKM